MAFLRWIFPGVLVVAGAACNGGEAGGPDEACSSSDECPAGSLCLDSICRRICTADTGCAPADRCASGTCGPGAGECTQHSGCPSTGDPCQVTPATCVGGSCNYSLLPIAEYCQDVDDDGACGTVSVCANYCSASAPAGYKPNCPRTDCNDFNAAIKFGATETCDGVDNNCNGATDEVLCPCTSGQVFDCNLSPACNPSQVTCTNGQIPDCPAPVLPPRHCLDADGDTYCTTQCGDYCPGAVPLNYRSDCTGTPGNDCNDSLASVSPSGTEVCNGVDDNCAGGVDDGFECQLGTSRPCNVCGAHASGTQSCVGCSYEMLCRNVESQWTFNGSDEPPLDHECGHPCTGVNTAGTPFDGSEWCCTKLTCGVPSGDDPTCYMKFGPYWGLPPGEYQVNFRGWTDGALFFFPPGNYSTFTIDVSDFTGGVVLSAAAIELEGDNYGFDRALQFTVVDSTCHQLEFRFWLNYSDMTAVKEIKVNRISPNNDYSLAP